MQDRITKKHANGRRRHGIAWLSLAILSLVGRSFGDSLTLRPSADTSLFATYPNNNLGSNLNLVSGGNGSGLGGRALIRFDLANQIPSNAVIQSVALTVNVVIVPGDGGVASVFDLRRVLVDWGEGLGTGNTGSPANDGEATWNNRFHPSTAWSVPGGAVTNDFSETVSACLLLSNIGSYTFSSASKLVADVQQWLSNPATNFGWVLISESEDIAFTARRLGSREDTNNAPALVVQYLLPMAPKIEWIEKVGGQVKIGFLASAGQSYTIQYRDSLASGNWLTLTNLSPQSMMTDTIVFDVFATNGQRFYRIGAF